MKKITFILLIFLFATISFTQENTVKRYVKMENQV